MLWLSFAAHQVLSWRRAEGERRQQLKWLASGVAVALGVGVVGSSLAADAITDAVEVDSVRDELAAVVHRTLEPAHVSVWLTRRDQPGLPDHGSSHPL